MHSAVPYRPVQYSIDVNRIRVIPHACNEQLWNGIAWTTGRNQLSFSLCQQMAEAPASVNLSAIANQTLVLPFPTLWVFYADSTFARLQWSLVVQAVPGSAALHHQ